MNRRQTTRHILMVRPANFGFNPETAVNNAFQQNEGSRTPQEIRTAAIMEFDNLVRQLRMAGVNVIVAKDTPSPIRPDAVFPNNWLTFHQEGRIITYPMFSSARRRERRQQIINFVLKQGFVATHRTNLEFNEKINIFLEGTGSIIFDHQHRLAYACLSPRTHASLLQELCQIIDYQPVIFHSKDKNGQDVYHTNVMMAMGEDFVVICLDSVTDTDERQMLVAQFHATGKEIIEISHDQMNRFAGNMLQVRNDRDEKILVMSTTAYNALNDQQIKTIEKYSHILHADIPVIETYGGGSVRCMMAEIFLPEKSA